MDPKGTVFGVEGRWKMGDKYYAFLKKKGKEIK